MKNANKLFSYKSFGPAILIFAALILAGLSGCSKDNPVQPAGSNNLGFSVTSDNGTGTNPQNVLQIYEAKVMINDLKIHPEGDDNEEHGENIKIGPFVINLNLDSKVNLLTSIYLPPGNYRKVKFEIHKLQPNEPSPDPDFVDANGRYSVVVKGAFNGMDFIYKSKITANQKLYLQKTLVLTSSKENSNITFSASPFMWFYDGNGNLLDPTLENNRWIIDDNIRDNLKNHIRIFIDDDHDGKPDN